MSFAATSRAVVSPCPPGPVVTMYDLLYDLGARSIPVPANSSLYADGGPLASLRRLKQDYREAVSVATSGARAAGRGE